MNITHLATTVDSRQQSILGWKILHIDLVTRYITIFNYSL